MSRNNSAKRPPWALRECALPGCANYAVAQCQAWDNKTGAVCAAPVCDWHRYGVSLALCPTHRGAAGKPLPLPPVKQETLF